MALHEAALLTVQQLQLNSMPNQETLCESELKNWLMNELSEKIQYDLEGLFQALYRIDIPESQFKKLLKETPPSDFIEKLAEAIIERQTQKIAFRKQYKI